MQIMIDIPKELYDYIKDEKYDDHLEKRFDFKIRYAVANAIQLPKGHGRLIDADKLPLNAIDDANYGSNYIRIAPTIIEADKEEE